MNKVLYHIFLFLVLLFLQVLILNNILLFGHINPYLYISFIFLYPFKENKFQILTLPCLYILELTMYIKMNQNEFMRNEDMHMYNTRNKEKFRQPYSRLTVCGNSPKHMGIKCFN